MAIGALPVSFFGAGLIVPKAITFISLIFLSIGPGSTLPCLPILVRISYMACYLKIVFCH